MKKLIQILLLLIITSSYSQNSRLDSWTLIAEEDPSLQPEYGNVQKTPEQIKSDEQFVENLLKEFDGNKVLAGRKMTELGFQYLYEKGDLVTAMRRFNQAFLVEQENADIYYGYGTIYFNLGAMDRAREQYEKGLKLNSEHSEILTDYGTTYLGDFYDKFENDKEIAHKSLVLAEKYLEKSYKIDRDNSNTIYKLAVVNMHLENCVNARKYLSLAQKMENPNITEAFENELNTRCIK